MKKAFFIFMAVVLLGSCSNPVLKWIDTPAGRENSGNNEGRMAGGLSDKEIISFTFGLGSDVENDLPISRNLDHTGKIPISVILSGVDSLENLTPEILFIGESIDPEPGKPQDFSSSVSSPLVYTVTAKDDSTRAYGVQVYLQNESSKEIVRFAVDTPSGLTAEGIIDQNAGSPPGTAGTITISVPADTDTGNLTAHIVHTGQTVRDSANRTYTADTFDMSGDFSTPGTWTVIAHDGGTKTYTVTVDREKSDAKEITSFSFHLTGEEDIIGAEPQPDGKYPILVVLPQAAYTVVDGSSRAPFIDFIGESISPEETASSLNFTSPTVPVTYTVAAENGSTRDYVVNVIQKELPADHEAEITGFYVTNPLVQGIIDQTAKTITLMVPAGTDLQSLRPEIYYRGASVSPRSGQPQDFTGSDTTPVPYTVRARDGSSQIYTVSVYTIPVPPTVQTGTDTADVGVGTDTDGNYVIIVDYPVHIEDPVININYPGSSQAITIDPQVVYSEPAINVIVNQRVVVINPPAAPPTPSVPPLGSAASIDYFVFANPAAIGVIDIGSGAGTDASPIPIGVTVPYGTDLRSLSATIVFTGKGIAGLPGHSPLKDSARSFQTPVDYVVMAENDAETAQNRKYYRVTVTPGEPNDAKDITAFSFLNVPPTKVLISGVANAAGNYPIEITVPLGTILTGVTPVITHTGVSIAGGTYLNAGPSTVTATAPEDFSSPIDYTVTAQDGSSKTYAVTVQEEVDEDIEITGFYFTSPLAVGKINQSANAITVTVPSGTNRAGLKPSVYFKGMALNPGSGAANDFTTPAMYTVTGTSGKTRTYTVMVNPTPSNSKDITRFKLSGVVNSGLVIGAAPDADGTYPIFVQVPSGTNLVNLGTEITHTGVSVSPAAESPGDFNSPRNYTVTAEDGSVKTYKVTVHAATLDAKLITSLTFNIVPLTGGGTVRVTAAIDQAGRTITATVPNIADVSGLRPTITYIGKSITAPSGDSSTANPFTDSAGRDFSSPQTYTVKDQNGDPAAYTVTVIRWDGFTAAFEGEEERTIIGSNTFDPDTGLITVTVDASKVDGPYDWYIDGVKQGVSGGTFSLNIGNGSFYPGRYELMVSGTKNGLRYTGKVYFVVAGRS
jgi:hypothetical protein